MRSCASAAARSIFRPSSPSPWKLYGELRGLKAPPRSTLAPARLHRGGRRLDLLLGLGRARPGHHDDLVAADPDIADGDDGVLGLERAARELVGLGDPHHLVHAVEHLEQPRVVLPSPPTAPMTVRSDPVDRCTSKPICDQLGDHALDLLLACAFLHHHDHVSPSLSYPALSAAFGERALRPRFSVPLHVTRHGHVVRFVARVVRCCTRARDGAPRR